MTTATESPFKSDSTPSNKCGFTLMNNQVGEIVAAVMARGTHADIHLISSSRLWSANSRSLVSSWNIGLV